MRKTTKKLLSSALAGLFVLSSLPLMGAAEAEGNTALAYTPTLDGVKDEAYDASYNFHMDAAYGGVDGSFLYDADYIYMYLDVTSAEKSLWDIFGISMIASATPNNDMTAACKAAVHLVSNPFYEGNEIRNWQQVMTGYQNLGFNLGWQEAVPEDDTLELVKTTPATEYAANATETGTGLEIRIAYKNLVKGDAISFATDAGTNSWGNVWSTENYETFTLGEEYKTETPAGNEAIKYTPVLDGVKDAAYDKSYNFHMDAAYGGVDGSFLYDADYIYMYLDVTSAEKSLWDIFGISMIASATPNNDMDAACKAAVHLVSNPFYEGNEIRNWQQVMTGYQNLGFNLGWQEAVPEDDTLELVKTTPATEFAANATETGTGLEIRIAYKNLVKGDAVSFATDAGTNSWGNVWSSENYETFILGDDFGHTHVFDEEYTVDVAPTCVSKGSESRHCKDFAECGGKTDVREIAMIDHNVVDGTCTMCGRQNVKKATPTLDGVLDDAYLSSAVYKTVDNAKAGKAEMPWSIPATKHLMALKKAGIPVEGKLPADANYDIPEFAKAETYFLWDDDAIYVFSKVYDSAIFPISADEINEWIAAGQRDVPWINDDIQHSLDFLGDSANNITVMANAGGNSVFARNANGVTTIGQYLSDENNTNVAGTVEDGYYTIELRLPVNNDLKEFFLTEGTDFDYGYGLFDVSTEKAEDGGNGMNHGQWVWVQNQADATASFVLVADDTPVVPDTTAPDVSDTAEPPTESETEAPVDPQPSSNVIKKGTPELDGMLDGKYLGSAVYRTIDSAKAGKSEFGWSTPSAAKRMALIRAGVMKVNGDAYDLLPDGDFSVSAFAKSETYFLWDDDALYIFSTIYDSDPLAIVGEDAAAKNDWAYNDIPWLSDNIVHNIYTAVGNLAIEANAGGELVYDRLLNGTPLGTPTVSSIAGRCTWENSDNVRGIVEDDRYTIEVRIPILDSVKADVLKDGATFDYGYWIFDGDGHPTDAKWTWIKNKDTELTSFTLSADAAIAPDTTAPDVSDTNEPPTDTPDVSDTNEPPTDTPEVSDTNEPPTDTPEVSDTNEPPTDTPEVSDTNEPPTDTPEVSDTNEPPTDTPEVSDTNEPPTPDNLGDVNGDGIVNAKDLVRLMKRVAGDETIEIIGTADINGDGVINSKDLVRLMKIIAEQTA